MTQSQFQSTASGASQCARILAHLKVNQGQWVAMPELGDISGSRNVHSRIADLRKRGHVIEPKQDKRTKPIKSFYRLV